MATPGLTPTTPDPFTAMGGGVWKNGGWTPKDNAVNASATAAPGGTAAPASDLINFTPTAAPVWKGSNVATPTYSAPAAFAAPTADQMTVDPGYQFRLNEGQRALQNSGAARGTLRSGAMMSDLLNYGQQAASQEYQNVYNRAKDIYSAATDRAKDLYGAQGDAYQRDFTERTSAFAPQMTQWQADNLAKQRNAEYNADREWQRTLYTGDSAFRDRELALSDAYRNRAYAGDDAFRYANMDEERKRFLINVGLD